MTWHPHRRSRSASGERPGFHLSPIILGESTARQSGRRTPSAPGHIMAAWPPRDAAGGRDDAIGPSLVMSRDDYLFDVTYRRVCSERLIGVPVDLGGKVFPDNGAHEQPSGPLGDRVAIDTLLHLDPAVHERITPASRCIILLPTSGQSVPKEMRSNASR